MRFITGLLALLILAILVIPAAHAYNQTEVCESQCQAWKFVWQDDYAFDYLKTMCAKEPTDVGLEMIGFWADIVEKGLPLQGFMEAYLCYDITVKYLQPQITACKATCRQNNLSYAPNLYLDDYSVYYDDDKHEILVRIRNNGRAYMPGVFVTVYAGDSNNISMPTNFRLLKNTTLGGITPGNVRYLPEGYDVQERAFTVPYTPKPDKYNVIEVFVSPEDLRYQEMGMGDNGYKLVINDLPTPAILWIESAEATRNGAKTDTFIVHTELSNKGELPADAEVRYYLGSPKLNQLAASENVRVDADGTAESEQTVVFQPGAGKFLTVQLVSNGQVIMERTLYPNPAFFYIEGKVMDETERPIPGAIVQVGPFSYSDFPLQSGEGIVTIADETGHYELPAVFTEEGTVQVYSRKPGYFTNSTNVTLTYAGDDLFWDYERTITADIILTQEPVQVSTGYPTKAKYIIETDKGRFTGDYAPGGYIPVQGANGTIFMASENCSYFVGKFNTTYTNGYLEYRPNVTCLSPDTNDDYTILQKPEPLWNKTYSGEEPRVVVFDKRGDHVYVITAENEGNFNNVYGYDLVTGNQQFKFESNANGIQRSVVMPSYDGSQVYLGMNAPPYGKKGENRSKGYMVDESGQVLYTWLFPETTETLLDSSAGTMAELVQYRLFFYAPGGIMLRQCNLVQDKPCEGSSKSATIDLLGISNNRALGTCNSTSCIFRPAYGGVAMLDRHYLNAVAAGDYANDDVFVADYKGGGYFHNGQKTWDTDRNVASASMSPGGSYVVLAYDTYGLQVFSPEGESLYSSDMMLTGSAATERGIFYATHQGNKLSIYRLSTMTEPGSTTTSTGSSVQTGFVGQLFQVLVDIYNAFIQWVSSLFGG